MAVCRAAYKHVVVVDDDWDQVEAFAELLTFAGFVAYPYASPRAALAFLEEHRCDVLLTDIQMRGMRGEALAHRACEQNPALHVILISAFDPDLTQFRKDWLFFPKPIDFVKIKAEIDAW